MTDGSPSPGARPKIDISVPHSARVWNYLLGGKDCYQPDREVGDLILKMFPDIALLARMQRRFLAQAVKFLAGEAGIRQFLDIGTGLPTADNTHEVAQRVAPDARIVYVDNDPLVLVHAKALLTSTPPGVTDYVEADVRDTGRILGAAAATLDLDRPIALMMLGITGQLPDSEDPHALVRRLLEPLPPGSYLALCDGTDTSATLNEAIAAYNANSASSYHLRSPQRIADYFEGLDLVEPGVVAPTAWRPGGADEAAQQVDALCGIGRKA